MSRLVILAAALSLGAVGAAFAQDAADEDEIIVTGTRLGDPAQGVSVLTREATLQAPIGGLGETLEATPGIASSFFGAGASRPIIRGLGEDRIRILSNGVGVIDASAVSPDHAVTDEGLEAERIEVLRGPSALAYGGNAVGGVINVIDTRIAEAPLDAPFRFGFYGGAATGLNSAAAAASARFNVGALIVSLDGFTRASGDFEIPGYADAHAEDEIAGGADPADFAFGAAPNSFAEAESAALAVSYVGAHGFIGASVRRFESVYGIPEAPEEGGGGPPELFAGPRIDMAQTRWDVRGGLDRPFGVFAGVRIAGAIVDYTHAELEPSGEVGTVFTNEGWEGRVELAQREIAGFTGQFGVAAFSRDLAAVGDEAFITPTTSEEIGVFGVERFETGPFALEGGVRFDRRTLDNSVFGERDFDLVSASLSGHWHPSDALEFGVTFARTERAPTETELFAFGPHLATASFEVGDPTLSEEVATTGELTARVRLDRFWAEASFYRADFTDFIALIPTGDEEDGLPVFEFAQRDAVFTGGEIAGGVNLFEVGDFAFSADAAFDWVAASFDAGGDVPRIPPRTLTLGLEAQSPHVDARVEWADVADQDDVAAFETETAGYALWNARVMFRPVANNDRLAFLLDARNLTDEEARVHTSFVKDLLPRPGRSVRFAILSRF